MKATYVTHMGDDLLVVNAARVSFKKKSELVSVAGVEVLGESDRKLIKYLAEHKHWTPFGHPQICLHVKAPIFVRTQCFKHKVGFVENEVSRRYVDDDPEFFWPTEWRGRPENSKQGSSGPLDEDAQEFCDHYYEKAAQEGYYAYHVLLGKGAAPEQARMVLPQSMYTEWYWTGSLAAYARFCTLRLDPHAQMEIQELAGQIAEIIQPLFPVSWKNLVGDR